MPKINVAFMNSRLLMAENPQLDKKHPGLIPNSLAAARGISEEKAREIEGTLALPSGWIGRDNMKFAKLNSEDFDLLSSVLAAPPKVKVAVSQLLNAIRSNSA